MIYVVREVFKNNGEILHVIFKFVKIVEWKHFNKDMEVEKNDYVKFIYLSIFYIIIIYYYYINIYNNDLWFIILINYFFYCD